MTLRFNPNSKQLSSDNPLYILDSGMPGKNVAVFAAVHGNEDCGVRAINAILPELKIDRGTVSFVVGNPRALELDVRFTEQNVNRLFCDESALSDAEKDSYEYRRSRELMEILNSCDALLDVHSSGTPNAIPFVVGEHHSHDIVKQFPVKVISDGWDLTQPGGTDHYVNSRGKIGICIECGYHEDENSVSIAKEAILSFLESLEIIQVRKPAITNDAVAHEFLTVYKLYKTNTDFKPKRDFEDFEFIKSGTEIGTDGADRISTDEDSYIIFVRAREGSGQEAFLLAKRKPTL